MKTLLISAFSACAVFSSAQALDLSSPSNWLFDYRGQYGFAAANATGNATLTSLLGTSVGAVLNALQNGQITSNDPSVSLAQTGSTIVTSPLSFTASTPTFSLPVSSLTYGVGDFVLNALRLNDGAYRGTLQGTSLALQGPSLLTANATLDLTTTIFGVRSGSVFNLRAQVVDSSLSGTVDGISGGKGYHVAGASGQSSTIALFLSQDVYAANAVTLRLPSTQVGALQTTTTSWSLSRTAPAPVPEPASLAALGLGAASMLRRRSRRKA